MAQIDPEIDAMSAMASALEGIEDEARIRVLEWAVRRYGGEQGSSLLGGATSQQSSAAPGGTGSPGGEVAAFEGFVDLFDMASPRRDAERALVGGYWFQVEGGNVDFQAQDVNNALKDLGRGVSNITDALSKLEGRKPALVRQVAKSGRSKQARKKYKLTAAGVAAVKQMLANGGEPES
jgi:hypothetical protein